MIPRHGGRDDYAALFHEAGHTEHYAQRRRIAAVRVPPPRRQLGHGGLRVPVRAPDGGPGLAARPCWASTTPERLALRGFTRASKLVFLRRYAAKLSYELRAARRRAAAGRDAGALLAAAGRRGRGRLARARRTCPTWTPATTRRTTCARGRSRRTCAACCVERFGPSGSLRARRATCCATLWREGQRLDADELLAEVTGERLDFGVMRRGLSIGALQRTSVPQPTRLSSVLPQLAVDAVEHGLAVRVALLVVAQAAQLRGREAVEALLHLRGGQVVVAGDRQRRARSPARASSASPPPPSMRSRSDRKSSVARALRESRLWAISCASERVMRPRLTASSRTSSMCLRVSSTAFSGASTPRTIRSRAAATLPVPESARGVGSRRSRVAHGRLPLGSRAAAR